MRDIQNMFIGGALLISIMFLYPLCATAEPVAATQEKTAKVAEAIKTTSVKQVAKVTEAKTAEEAEIKVKAPGFEYTKPEVAADEAVASIRDLDAIVKSGEIIVALPKAKQTLFFSVDSQGKLSGYSIDLANEIGKELGVKVVYNRDAKSFDDVVNIISEGKADISVGNLSKTVERAKKILYSNPLLTLHRAVFVNRAWYAKQKELHGVDDPVEVLNASKARVGTLEQSAYVNFSKQLFSHGKIITYPTLQEMLKGVEKGEVDAVLNDDLQLKKMIEKQPGLKLTFETFVLDDKPDILALAASPKAWNLWQWLNQFLGMRVKSGTGD